MQFALGSAVRTSDNHRMDLVDYLRYVGALLSVLGMILGLYYVLRRWGGSAFSMLGNVGDPHSGGKSGKRLSIVEARNLDMRRRLVLIRRDDVEHLLVLGQDGDLVVERGIAPPGIRPARKPGAAVTYEDPE
jgi:flagellar protein FliO/FliZ